MSHALTAHPPHTAPASHSPLPQDAHPLTPSIIRSSLTDTRAALSVMVGCWLAYKAMGALVSALGIALVVLVASAIGAVPPGLVAALDGVVALLAPAWAVAFGVWLVRRRLNARRLASRGTPAWAYIDAVERTTNALGGDITRARMTVPRGDQPVRLEATLKGDPKLAPGDVVPTCYADSMTTACADFAIVELGVQTVRKLR